MKTFMITGGSMPVGLDVSQPPRHPLRAHSHHLQGLKLRTPEGCPSSVKLAAIQPTLRV